MAVLLRARPKARARARARARQTVAALFMVPTSYIGHSWLVVGMSAAAVDPVHSVLLMAVYSVRVPH